MSINKYIDELSVKIPSLSAPLADLYADHATKLYHQLTLKIENFIRLPEVSNNSDLLTEFYAIVVRDVARKINQTKLVEIAFFVAERMKDELAILFFKEVVESVKGIPLAYLFAISSLGLITTKCKKLEETLELIDLIKTQFNIVANIDHQVYAQFYFMCTEYYQAKGDFNECYKNGTLFLSYVDISLLSSDQKKEFATKMAIACLLGNKTYDFGELVQSRVVEFLTEPLKQLIRCFSVGDVAKHEIILNSNASEIPKIVLDNRKVLSEKIRVMALLSLIFTRPVTDRTIPFADIAKRTLVAENEVELLVMRALALGLIKGHIDQPQNVAVVEWTIPRILERYELKTLIDQFDSWSALINTTLVDIRRFDGEDDDDEEKDDKADNDIVM